MIHDVFTDYGIDKIQYELRCNAMSSTRAEICFGND